MENKDSYQILDEVKLTSDSNAITGKMIKNVIADIHRPMNDYTCTCDCGCENPSCEYVCHNCMIGLCKTGMKKTVIA